MPNLILKEISSHLKSVPKWSKRAKTILRTFVFAKFVNSIEFVNRIARKAQAADHHPDIDIRFNKVTLTFSTHDEGEITEKGFSLAQQCDEIFGAFAGSQNE